MTTSHPFEEFVTLVKKASGIYGDYWDAPLRAEAYKLAGVLIPRRAFIILQFKFDCRVPLVIDAISGSGTNLIKQLEKKVCETLKSEQLISSEIAFIDSSPTNEEQFVGTVDKQKDYQGRTVEYKPVKGEFEAHNLFLDDCDLLFSSQKHTGFRHRFIGVLDTLGKYSIYKRPTGVPADNALKYPPTCDCTFRIHTQNTKVPAESLRSGLFRRAIYFQVTQPENYEEFILDQKLNSEQDLNASPDELITCIKASDKSADIIMLPELKPKFSLLVKEVQKELRDCKIEGYEYIKHTIPEYVLKLATILAKYCNRTQISEDDLIISTRDTLNFFMYSLDFWQNGVEETGFVGYRVSADITRFILKYLEDKKAYDEEISTISIKQLLNDTCKEIFNEEYNQHKTKASIKVYNAYTALLRQNKIARNQVTSHETKVWLKTHKPITLNDSEEQNGQS